MDKIQQLYFIIEKFEDGKQFFCDNELNRIYEFDYHLWHNEHEGDCQYFRCYLFTKDEIELMKKKMGDGHYLESDVINDEYPIGMYVIFTMEHNTWVKDIYRNFGVFEREWYKEEYEVGDMDEISFDFVNYHESFDDYAQKICDGSYFDGDLVRRALKKSRVYPEFIRAFIKTYLKDYTHWWRNNYKRKKKRNY